MFINLIAVYYFINNFIYMHLIYIYIMNLDLFPVVVGLLIYIV